MIYNALSIAGSDPSGGAGIQADLKVFSAHNVYGMAAITALPHRTLQAYLLSTPPLLILWQNKSGWYLPIYA